MIRFVLVVMKRKRKSIVVSVGSAAPHSKIQRRCNVTAAGKPVSEIEKIIQEVVLMTFKPASAELFKKIANIQDKLEVTKNHYNDFGGYNYRSCEDILEKLKPLLKEEGLTLTINDQVQRVGDRYYIQATVLVTDGETIHRTTGFAREAEDKKKMDPSQLTGAASSYARKYALNGMFAIDDNKDADHPDKDDKKKPDKKPPKKPDKKKPENPLQELRKLYKSDDKIAIKIDEYIESNGNLANLPVAQVMHLLDKVKNMQQKSK